MQKLISKYGLAAHLAIVAVAPLFLSTVPVVCLSALAAVWLLMEPSRIGSEMLHDARRRVSRAIISDPLFWILLMLVGVTILRTWNSGVALAYDAELGRWSIANPAWPLLPGSVDSVRTEFVGCSIAALVVTQGCRHALGRSARAALALIASALSGVGALVLASLCHDGCESVLAAAGCPLTDLCYSGCVYGIFLLCALAALSDAFEARWLRVMPLTLLCVAGNAVGLFAFSPSAVSAAFAGAALILFVYVFVYLRQRLGRTSEFKYLVIVAMGLAVGVLVVMMCFPDEIVESRVAAFQTGEFVPEGFMKTRSVLSDLAARVWKLSPWLGTGLGSFPLDLQYHATSADWSVLSPMQKAVPNGYWMLLSERGVVGAFFLAVGLTLLLVTYIRRLATGVTRAFPSPLAWTGLLAVILAVLEMLVDVSFLSPSATVALASVLSVSASAFPRR